MNILLISHDLTVSGAPNSLLRQAKYFRSAGHRVIIWSISGGNLTPKYQEAGFTPQLVANDTSAIKQAFEHLDAKIDFILCNTTVTYKFVDVLQRFNIPLVWFIRETGVVNHMWKSNPDFRQVFAEFYNLYTVSDYAAANIRQYNPHVKVIHNAIEDSFSDFIPLGSKIRFGYIGSIQPVKGCDYLIEAFQNLHVDYADTQLVIAGNIKSDFAKSLYAATQHNPDITWVGEVQGADKQKFFDAIDVLCVPSLDEAFGLTLLEGAMEGKALIVSENCGAKFVVDNGQSGFIVPVSDVNAWRQAMQQCLDKSALLRMQQLSRRQYLAKGNTDTEQKAVLQMLADNINNLPIVKNPPLREHNGFFYQIERGKLVVSLFGHKLFSVKLKHRYHSLAPKPLPNFAKQSLSVIVPIYNAKDDVALLLESMLSNFNFDLGEVFLINDCSAAETSSYLADFVKSHRCFHLINNDENLGFIKSCNKGISLSHGNIIVLLNSDTKIPPEFCERILTCFASDAKIGVASPISSYTSAYFIPLPHGLSLNEMNLRLRQKHKTQYPLIPAAEGFCFCIRKQVIEQQGGLDEIYGKGYNEEVDFAYRAASHGWKNVLIDDLYVCHKRHASFGSAQRAKLIAENNKIFMSRWHDFYVSYLQEHHFTNPVHQIEAEMFPLRSLWHKLFSIKDSADKQHKIIVLFGIKWSIKNFFNKPTPVIVEVFSLINLASEIC